MSTEEVRDILRMAQLPVSLEKPIGEEEDSSLGDFVPDDQAESPFDKASLSLRREDIEAALGSLPERDRKVIELRFGLLGEAPCTLEEVGRAFGVTRERIRQIENNTLKRLECRLGPAAPRLRLKSWGNRVVPPRAPGRRAPLSLTWPPGRRSPPPAATAAAPVDGSRPSSGRQVAPSASAPSASRTCEPSWVTFASSGADARIVSETTLPVTSPTSTLVPCRWRPETLSSAWSTDARASAMGRRAGRGCSP